MNANTVIKMLLNRRFRVIYGKDKGGYWATVERDGITYFRTESKRYHSREWLDITIAEKVIANGIKHLAPETS